MFCTYCIRMFLSLLFLFNLSSVALPVGPKLSADSLSVFSDPNSHYPQLHDALHSLCRDVAGFRRTYEMDQIYRTSELRKVVIGKNLDAACGELPGLLHRQPILHDNRDVKKVYVGSGSP